MDIEKLYQLYLEHPTVTTDSRRCTPGSLFFALKGASFDGNRFAAQALSDGCAAAVVDDASAVVAGDNRYVLVDDVLAALQALAAHHRQHFRAPVVQVTGTNGKTTTKELLAAVLSKKYNVLYTQGNLNNHIGVPLTLLRLRTDEHTMAIIETGANHPGEIAFLAHIVDPDCGLITNVGRAHIEGFGSFEGVKRTKGELYDYLAARHDGLIFLNGSSADLAAMASERGFTPHRMCVYGHPDTPLPATVTGEVAACTPTVRLRWHADGGPVHEVQTQLIGDYNLDNLLAAVAVGTYFGVAPEDIDAALADYHPTLGRSEFRRTADNELVVDAYNANPSSMQAALTNFARFSHPHKMVILGDMRELGTESEAAHRQVIAALAQCGIEQAWLVGQLLGEAVAAEGKPEGIDVRTFADVEAVKVALQEQKPKGCSILIKGSNGTRLHQLPELL